MQYRFRYQPKNGSRVIFDVPASAEVRQAADGAGFEVDRLSINGVDVPTSTGLHEDLHDFLTANFTNDIARILSRAGENATAIARAVL